MPGYFERLPGGEGGASVTLDDGEISVLRSLTVQLLELIGPDQGEPENADPLNALFAEGPSEPPSDPALARLFPDAYGDPESPPDPAARTRSAEFRRFTESDLRTQKRDRLLAMVRALDEARSARPEAGGEAVLTLDRAASDRWLGGLNDLRLVIGARLGIEDESTTEKLFDLPDEDPRKPMVIAFLWLGSLQETLVETLLP
ncbi:DUF2017 family protein [Streptomyces sp. 3MP-14]|uniref:DUF2017 family protein n=1 Tax=Streptomyces mimosae TaxID=2586635 RepID=A0A5N6A170_9ACTN|nr:MULTISPECIES: DUF2017 domain-containing protein [Streptomyces]KAB8161420.1 DUF2017 family protein [Streptomyces mimosae]KAB8173256.1 DUF2017 family protein [Streptomyces sp. 3MP-14]